MNDINKAQCWCNRLYKLMKEKNYTQKSFLKEYKEKYGGGTQANISRWLRVGSKIENGKTIGFPSYETMSNLADFFGVSVGYLIGETDYESFEMEKVCKFLGLEEETVKAIKGITSGENMGIGANSMCGEYKSAFRYILTASSFPVFIKEVMGSDIPDNIDLFTYSFPCQDLSLCGCWHGNKSGIARDAHNRSGMLWEVERILLEMNEMGKELPRFLLMENVTNILSKPHAADFGDWKETLENLGYYNKIYRLNAQNFGIPQKRERAYMISILCKNNAETIAQVEKYFEEHNLEKDEATRLKQRNLRLKDILCLDYDDVPRYKEEADASKPNDTPSRRKIWEDNELLYDGKEIRDIVVNTVTTKQDRNPNSGLIIYKNRARGKTKWRYLTPRECFKLMGFDESDFDRIISDNPMVTKNRYLYSTEKLIKLAGNSIVVDVLEAIFRQIMDINGKILGERK